MTELHTNVDLLRALEKSVSRTPSREQIENQRLSFVMGALPMDSNMTRSQVQEMLDSQAGR